MSAFILCLLLGVFFVRLLNSQMSDAHMRVYVRVQTGRLAYAPQVCKISTDFTIACKNKRVLVDGVKITQ